ncbi:MAG: Chromosome-partitioning protein Spo0J [Pelotomaculum sp. PtaU1.Bin065]|nr:MAG: Chromosome-partitioning protein Spo0J [Pelotomaculum sp. PtaU1.Bin065]
MSLDGLSSFTYLKPYQIVLVGNVRKNFDEVKLLELAESIKENGVIEPLIVRGDPDKTPNFKDDSFELIAGERRLRAVKLVGLDKVPVRIMFIDKKQAAKLQLIENVQREDLNPVEEAYAYKALLVEHGYTQEKLAAELGVSQAYIANRIRLLELPEMVQENISRGIISPSAAKELLVSKRAANPQIIEKVAREAADEGMTVKQVAAAVAREIWNNSKGLTKEQYSGPHFDTGACEKCKKKTMLKHPWNYEREELRCLNLACWEEKEEEVARKIQEDREKEALVKYPDAVIINDLKKFETVYTQELQEHCRAKGCEHFKVGRWRERSSTQNICLNPDSYEACREEAKQQQRREREEKESSARMEIEQLVNRKIENMESGVFNNRQKEVLIYIAGALMGGFEYTEANINVFEYLEGVAGDFPEDWEDGNPCDSQGWPYLLGVLENLSEAQLLRIIFELPALGLGMEPGGMVQWFLKGVPVSEEPALKISGRVGWILHNSVGDINYDTNIPRLTDDELIHCLRHEERKSGLTKLMAEARRRGIQMPAAEGEDESKMEHFEAKLPEEFDVARAKCYLDDQGRELFVSRGLWFGDNSQVQYGTFWRNHTGGLHRVKSPAMPMVASEEEAQKNLDVWAEKKGFKLVEPIGESGVA